MNNQRSVLFVCTANICRSPMAMGLMRHKVSPAGPDSPADEIVVASAGTWALGGQPAALNSILAMAELGIDISDHASRVVDLEMISRFNLVLTMETGHKEALQVEFMEYASRVYLLSEMIGRRYNIQDPIGKSLREFRHTAAEIDKILTSGYSKILSLSVGVPASDPGEQ